MAEPTITDQEFLESKQSQEVVYRDEGKRQADRTYLDPLGHARWDTDYYTLRKAGWPHGDALREVRCRIREAWSPPLPPLEQHPEAPKPPTPDPPKPPVDQPGVLDNMQRFADYYLGRCNRTGFRPDERSTRESRIQFLQSAILGYRAATGDRTFVMKRASETRPISDEVIVFVGTNQQPISVDDYRRFWDFLASGGSADWHVKTSSGELGHGEILPSDQVLVDPLTLNSIPG